MGLGEKSTWGCIILELPVCNLCIYGKTVLCEHLRTEPQLFMCGFENNIEHEGKYGV